MSLFVESQAPYSDSWWDEQPPWVRKAYRTDPTIHSILDTARIMGTSETVAFKEVARLMWTQKVDLMERLVRTLEERGRVS